MEGTISGRIGYVTGRSESKFAVHWVQGIRGPGIVADNCSSSVLKHYLRPGDKVRCRRWRKMPRGWKDLGDATGEITDRSYKDSPLVMVVAGTPCIPVEGREWSLAHVEKV